MTANQDTERRQMVDEAHQLILGLNTHLDLCEAQKITVHLELTGGRIRPTKISRQREEEVLWEPEDEEGNGNA